MKIFTAVIFTADAPTGLFGVPVIPVSNAGTKLHLLSCTQFQEVSGGLFRLVPENNQRPGMALLVKREHVLMAVQAEISSALGFLQEDPGP